MKKAESVLAEYASNRALQAGEFFRRNSENILAAAFNIAVRLARGGKLFTLGAGVHARDAQNIAAAFIGCCHAQIPALPAIALVNAECEDTPYEDEWSIYTRQIEVLCTPGDALLLIAFTNHCQDLLEALKLARETGLYVLAVTRENCEGILAECEASIIIARENNLQSILADTAYAIHMLCCYYLFENVREIAPFTNPQ